MRIKVERKWPKAKYIIGRMYIDGEYLCNTLEPPWKNNERYTAIPEGYYEIMLNYSPKFKRVLPLLLDVKGRSSIRIHRGNYPKDTQGCILVGENTKVGVVLNSTKYEEKIVKLIQQARSRNDKIIIQVCG